MYLQRNKSGNLEELELNVVAQKDEDIELLVSSVEAMMAHTRELLAYMQRGATMTKCRSKDQYQRRFYLTEDKEHIRWEPSKDASSKIPLTSVKFIRLGQRTAAFRKSRNIAQFAHLSFSLVYGNDFETLDLIAHRQEDYDRWIAGLQALVAGASDR